MITVENLGKSFSGQAALRPVSIAFKPAATTVLIGPSGCGKSTLLKMLLGLIEPDSGQVRINEVVLTRDNRERLRHGIGYVIQDGGLFPHLRARDNVILLARFLQRPAGAIETRLAALADLVQLTPAMLQRFPAQLSGGQRQRVGLMRALMLDPDILLLDEPLGALDPITRFELQAQLKDIFAALHKTVILVTHDMNEAAYLGDEIVLMRAGEIVQRGTLDELLRTPRERYVSDFIRAQRSNLPPAAGGSA